MWYNNKVARKEARRWSLKIEQQEMKYKAYLDMCKCERISTILYKRILLNKSKKEAKSKTRKQEIRSRETVF